MKCLLVHDKLFETPFKCLEFDDNIYVEIAGVEIPSSHEDFYPDIYEEGDDFLWCNDQLIIVQPGEIFFSWINQSLGSAGALENGDSVIIEFDASVIEYCECEGDDCCISLAHCIRDGEYDAILRLRAHFHCVGYFPGVTGVGRWGVIKGRGPLKTGDGPRTGHRHGEDLPGSLAPHAVEIHRAARRV